LTERGWALISDFDSRGADSIPDPGVREGLTIALQQSQYVNVYPRTRVYEVLQRMKKDDVTHIAESLGREICQRENLHVLLTGSIEHIGRVFQITVRAVDPSHATLLFAEEERFDKEDQFFDRAHEFAASRMTTFKSSNFHNSELPVIADRARFARLGAMA
jgi:TolB-like protein